MAEPWRLFRFRPINEYLWQELELSEIYCCSPEKLNDPFDCRLDWESSLESALASPSLPQERKAKLQAILTAFRFKDPRLDAGVCCFSINLNNHLMWSHYTNSHRGVCLLYEFPATYFADRYQYVPGPTGDSGELYFVGGSRVHYGDDAFREWLIKGDFDKPLPGDATENAVSRIFSSKAKCWEHEEEFRVITSKPGSMAFDPRFLKQVTFGLATEDGHKRIVTQMAKRNNSNVILSVVRRSTASDFGVEFPEMSG